MSMTTKDEKEFVNDLARVVGGRVAINTEEAIDSFQGVFDSAESEKHIQENANEVSLKQQVYELTYATIAISA